MPHIIIEGKKIEFESIYCNFIKTVERKQQLHHKTRGFFPKSIKRFDFNKNNSY